MSLLNRLYHVPKQGLHPLVLEKWRAALTVQPQIMNYATGELADAFPMFEESATHFSGPKFAMRRLVGQEERNEEFLGTPIDLEFRGQLKAERYQPQAVQATIDALQSSGGGILSLSCGLGKTVDALAVCAALRVKTLVIVHKVFLMDQWRERINQFLPGARVGIIQAQTVEVENCDIVLATMQSLSMIPYPPETLADFGLVIVDEAHRVCAQTMNRCLPRVAARYMLALSATPRRKDGLDQILEFYFNDICFEARREQEFAIVNLVHFTFGEQKERWIGPPGGYGRGRGKGRLNFSKMVTELTMDEARNQLLGQMIARCVEGQRKVLLLSDRREHLDTLYSELQIVLANVERQLDDEDVEEWAVPELAKLMRTPVVDYYIGGRKKEELKQAESADVILATYAMANEGLDITPPPDALILSTPKADIEQAVGRIMREASSTLGAEPIIYDLVDPWSMFLGLAAKRRCFYKDRAYEQRHFTNDSLVQDNYSDYAEENAAAERAYEQLMLERGEDPFADDECPI